MGVILGILYLFLTREREVITVKLIVITDIMTVKNKSVYNFFENILNTARLSPPAPNFGGVKLGKSPQYWGFRGGQNNLSH